MHGDDTQEERRSRERTRRIVDHLEPEEERRLRHFLDGQIQYATVQQLESLTAVVTALTTSVHEMIAWFKGDMIDGEYQEGVFSRLKRIDNYAKTIVGLLAAAVTAGITTAIGIWVHFIFGVKV